MQQVRSITIIRVICLAAFIFMSSNTTLAQDKRITDTASARDEATLQALLNEVRLLRLTIQNVNLQAYRIQITLERLRIQQEHADRLARQLEDIRNELADMRQSRAQMIERAKDVEDKIKSDPDEESRAQAGNVLKDLQFEIQQQSEKEQARREREGQLASQLQSEQTKLYELNNRLETLEREMETLNPAATSQPRKPRP